MAPSQVIQGYFPHGLPRFDNRAVQPKAGPPAWVQEALSRPSQAHTPPHRPAVPDGAVPTRTTASPRSAPTAQPVANGMAVQLPAHFANLPRCGGQPLPPAVQRKMEAAFGASFADVRVHLGPQPSAIGALAFTHGSDLYFAPGHYNPSTPQGQQLLGHELAHVVQQRAGRVRNPFGSGIAAIQDRSMEAEAERMGRHAAMHPGPVQAKPSARRQIAGVGLQAKLAGGGLGIVQLTPCSLCQELDSKNYDGHRAENCPFNQEEPAEEAAAENKTFVADISNAPAAALIETAPLNVRGPGRRTTLKNTSGHHAAWKAKWRKRALRKQYEAEARARAAQGGGGGGAGGAGAASAS